MTDQAAVVIEISLTLWQPHLLLALIGIDFELDFSHTHTGSLQLHLSTEAAFKSALIFPGTYPRFTPPITLFYCVQFNGGISVKIVMGLQSLMNCEHSYVMVVVWLF